MNPHALPLLVGWLLVSPLFSKSRKVGNSVIYHCYATIALMLLLEHLLFLLKVKSLDGFDFLDLVVTMRVGEYCILMILF